MDPQLTSAMIAAGAAVIAAIIGLGGLLIGSKLTYARSSKEKFWDFRRQAYGIILSELAVVERICNNADEAMQEVGKPTYFNSSSYQKDNHEIAQHMTIVNRKFSEDYLTLSNKFLELFETFRSELWSSDDVIPPNEHERFASAIRKYRLLLMDQARREIAVQN
jgi:hypothetical protein